MSGTSLDGIDLAFVNFHFKNNKVEWNIMASEFVEYSEDWKNQLSQAHLISSNELLVLDVKYGKFIGQKVNEFIIRNDLQNIDAIASHGHTIFHQPEKGFTLQIGSGSHIHAQTNLKVISDFRSLDVALGGQGAPLVPMGDKFLFSQYDACVNLGGFANISFDNSQNQRIAFDICPLNFVLNHLCKKIGKSYDENGEIARNAKINMDLFSTLNQIEFYQKFSPKSLGREWVEKVVFPILEKSEITIENQISTFTYHAAFQISNILNQNNFGKILFSGGGAKNEYLILLIQSQNNTEIKIENDNLTDFKEALIFAFLGGLRLLNQINILRSVTGASRDSISGKIYE